MNYVIFCASICLQFVVYITKLMLDSAVYIIFKCYKVAVFHRILLGNLISELPLVNVQIITVVHIGNVPVFVIVFYFCTLLQ